MNKVCIVIRVYNRIEDLKYCIQIIRHTWKNLEYYIIVVSNGQSKGYIISGDIKNTVDKLIVLENNYGHLKGNSQLLIKALPFIPDDCKYTVILEADTWLYGDEIIQKYISRLEIEKAVWASAQWYLLVYSLATDFAIIESTFLKNNPEIFEFDNYPEYYVANYLKKKSLKPIYITENMPVNLPNYIKSYPYATKGRFNIFLKSRMVTHHIEELPGGMAEKKMYFNTASGVNYFGDLHGHNTKKERLRIKVFKVLYYLIPHKSWFTRSFKDLR